jgi:hypothetical protein
MENEIKFSDGTGNYSIRELCYRFFKTEDTNYPKVLSLETDVITAIKRAKETYDDQIVYIDNCDYLFICYPSGNILVARMFRSFIQVLE